jgi:hypothetical protein
VLFENKHFLLLWKNALAYCYTSCKFRVTGFAVGVNPMIVNYNATISLVRLVKNSTL